MLWTEFGPFVLPYVSGCPEPVLEHHARLTTMDFCRRTLCYARTLDPAYTSGFPVLELYPDTGTKIVKIQSVTVDGRDFDLVGPKFGQKLVDTGSQQEFCFTTDNTTITINPVQAQNLPVVVTAALAPTLDADSIDDAVGNDHVQDIAPGIISAIMRIPNEPFSAEMNTVAMYAAGYAGRVSAIAAKVARGMAGVKMRNHVTFL